MPNNIFKFIWFCLKYSFLILIFTYISAAPLFVVALNDAPLTTSYSKLMANIFQWTSLLLFLGINGFISFREYKSAKNVFDKSTAHLPGLAVATSWVFIILYFILTNL